MRAKIARETGAWLFLRAGRGAVAAGGRRGRRLPETGRRPPRGGSVWVLRGSGGVWAETLRRSGGECPSRQGECPWAGWDCPSRGGQAPSRGGWRCPNNRRAWGYTEPGGALVGHIRTPVRRSPLTAIELRSTPRVAGVGAPAARRREASSSLVPCPLFARGIRSRGGSRSCSPESHDIDAAGPGSARPSVGPPGLGGTWPGGGRWCS